MTRDDHKILVTTLSTTAQQAHTDANAFHLFFKVRAIYHVT
jgi:hypothetical protein